MMFTVESVEGVVSPPVCSVEVDLFFLIQLDVAVDCVFEEPLGFACLLELGHQDLIYY